MYGFHNMSNIEKFRSGNLLENGNKNQWNLPCGDLLLFLICTWSFGKNSLLRVHINYNKNSPHGKFHRFLFPFSSKFPDLNFAPQIMFSLFTHVMKLVRDTKSEPGLPVVKIHSHCWWENRLKLVMLPRLSGLENERLQLVTEIWHSKVAEF